jgi:hypothetical protein
MNLTNSNCYILGYMLTRQGIYSIIYEYILLASENQGGFPAADFGGLGV